MMFKSLIFLSLFFFIGLYPSLAQSSAEREREVIITLNDKSEIRGLLVEENDKTIVIKSGQLGLLTFQKGEIRDYTLLSAKGWNPNPNPTRYFIGQSAYSLNKGEGYYQNIMALFNSVQYGLTDKLSAGVGLELISLTSGNPIIYANMKYAIPVSNKFRLAASANFFRLLDEASIGTLSGLATYGTEEHNFTIGAGYGIGEGEISSDAVITVNGMTRLTKRIGLVTENYILPGNSEFINAIGFRLINKKNTMDFMLLEGLLPLVDFVFKF